MKKDNIKSGIQWNLISYIVLGILTVFSYCMITWWYGKDVLGAYSIVLSFFMICGHIGVLGLQSAMIYFIPRQSEDKVKLGKCFFSFLAIVSVVSTLLAAAVWLMAEFIGGVIFSSQWVAEGLRFMAPAVILFSVNKLIGGYINGIGKMRHFAVLQSTRYFLIVFYIGMIAFLRLEYVYFFGAFLISEAGVLLLGILFLRNRFAVTKPDREYICEGIIFGGQAMCGNVLSDINTRVDVMMLGTLCDDAAVGLYSFVTIIAEGMISVLFVFRSNFNPRFAELLFQKKTRELALMLREHKKKLKLFFVGAGIMIMAGYTLLCMLLLEKAYIESILPALIIVAACVFMAPYFVFGNICTLYGKPLVDTGITVFTILLNGILNYMLIPRLQIVGAAMATGISYGFFSILVCASIKRLLEKSKGENKSESM